MNSYFLSIACKIIKTTTLGQPVAVPFAQANPLISATLTFRSGSYRILVCFNVLLRFVY